MKLSDAGIKQQDLRAPQEPYTSLIQPSSYAVSELLQDNRRLLADVDVAGIGLDELSATAREQLYHDALDHTRGYRDVASPACVPRRVGTPQTLILSGHQPELFHPGVWFKNFALSEFAREHAASAIHVLIDNDVCRHTTIRIPTGSIAAPEIADVPMDASGAVIPYEERMILDPQTFASFGDRVLEMVGEIVPKPLVSSLWTYATNAAEHPRPLGQVLAVARHRIEQAWGMETLEVPLSTVCDTPMFRRFFLGTVLRLRDFHGIHNDVLSQFRHVYGIRSASHPVPELRSRNGWLETPFWCWTKDDPTRRPLFGRYVGANLQLQSDGNEKALELETKGDMSAAIEILAAAREQGFKIRPRALLTTMYMRLFLSDLFLHGIGGAKYDELTDEIIRQFWQLEPPGYMTLTATIPLPVSRPTVEVDDIRRLDGLLRDLWYHPEQHFDLSDLAEAERHQATALAKSKLQWIQTTAERGQGKHRHNAIVSTNEKLRRLVAPLRGSLLDERQRLSEQLRQANVLSSRDYSFCLFPGDMIRQTLLDLLH